MTIEVEGGELLPSVIRNVPALGWNTQQQHAENARANDARQSHLDELSFCMSEKLIDRSESPEERRYYADRYRDDIAASRAQSAKDHATNSANQASALDVVAMTTVGLAILGGALFMAKRLNGGDMGDVALVGYDPISL